MYLTLAGERQYEATKVWLDEGDEAARPEAELQLWRYRVGQSYETAAPMRGADGNIITLRLDTDKDTEQVVFTGSDGSPLQLPKYDAEGYRYLYVAREYLYGSGYEQVFGRVEEDAVIDRVVVDGQLVDTSDPADRQEGDTFLYNGGDPFQPAGGHADHPGHQNLGCRGLQSEFQDVRVQLGLFARPAGSQGQWEDTGESVEMSDFSSENLSGQATRWCSSLTATAGSWNTPGRKPASGRERAAKTSCRRTAPSPWSRAASRCATTPTLSRMGRRAGNQHH